MKYAGQRKVANDIEKRFKKVKSSAKSNEKKKKFKEALSYLKIKNKNKAK